MLLIFSTFLLLSYSLQSSCFLPLPCEQYTHVDDVMRKFTQADVRHDARSSSRLREADWKESPVGMETNRVAGFLENEAAHLSRVANSGGFHREVVTCLNMNKKEKISSNKCWVMMEETVPTSFYVDVYAMERETEGEGKYFFFDYIDIEAPEYEASSYSFLTFSPLNSTDPHCHASSKVTWHLRYHRPSESGANVHVKLPHPKVYLYCQPSSGKNTNRICGSKGDTYAAPCPDFNSDDGPKLCEWREVKEVDYKREPRFSVPVGDQWHEIAAVGVTLLVTFVGSFVIMQYFCNENVDEEDDEDCDEDEFCAGENYFGHGKTHNE